MSRKNSVPDKQAIAEKMAQFHYDVDDDVVGIYWLVGKRERKTDPIKLLEVNRDTIPAGIMPLGFPAAPASGRPYPYIIVQVTPQEFDKIRSAELPLPHGWKIGEEIPNHKPKKKPPRRVARREGL